jgi:hypothetical protein
MKYAVEIGSGHMMSLPSFINIGSGFQLEEYAYRHRQQGDLISLPLFLSK